MTLDILALIVTVVGASATTVASYARLGERVSRHDRSIEDFGKRIGQLERQESAAAAVAAAELSRPYNTGGIPR